MEEPTKGVGQNFLPVFSPDGTQHCVHVEPRRQLGDLRHEPRRLGPAAADQQSGDRIDADLVADRHADRVHVRPHAARRRSTSSAPTAPACGRSTFESYADRPTWSPAPYNEIAFAARTGPGFDIKILSLQDRRDAADHLRRRHQREPGVGAERPPHGVHVDARRQAARSSPSIATAGTCGRSRRTATTSRRTGRSSTYGRPRGSARVHKVRDDGASVSSTRAFDAFKRSDDETESDGVADGWSGGGRGDVGVREEDRRRWRGRCRRPPDGTVALPPTPPPPPKPGGRADPGAARAGRRHRSARSRSTT